MKYFLDTYALIEIAQGNQAYKEYSQAETVTLRDNVAEMYYFFNIRSNKEAADFFFNIFSRIIVEFPVRLIPEAMEFRRKLRPTQKFSYIDSFGYTLAVEHEITFITGDRGFKNLKYVKIIR